MKSAFPDIQEYPFDDHLVLYHGVSEKLVALNSTGQFIWQNYSKGLGAIDIANLLATKFSVSAERALYDVKSCLYNWQQNDFLGISKLFDVQPLPEIAENHANNISVLPETILWHSSQCIKLAGKTVKLQFGDSKLHENLSPIFKHLQIADNSFFVQRYRIWRKEEHYFIQLSSKSICSTDSLYEAVGWIFNDIVTKAFSRNDSIAVLHGGAVKYGDSAIILPGRKGSGKSTLIAALQYDGFEYLSDDVCPLENNKGQLVPVPMSQRLKSGSWEVLEPLCSSLKNLPVYYMDSKVKFLTPVTGDHESWNMIWPVSGLIFPQFQSQAASMIHRIRPLEALRLLMSDESVGFGCIRSLLSWLENMPAFVIRYSDLTEARECFASATEKILSL